MENFNEIADKLCIKFSGMKASDLKPFIAKILQKPNGKQLLSLIEDKALAMADFKFLRQLSKVKGVNKEKIDKAVLATKDAETINEYCHYRKAEDLQPFEDALIEINNARCIFEFAIYTKEGENIEKLQQAICKSGNSRYIFKFAKELKRRDLKMLADAYLNSPGVYMCEMCFDCGESINMDFLGERSEFNQFANLNGVDVSKFVDFALKLKDEGKDIYAFTNTDAYTSIYAANDRKFIEQEIERCKKARCAYAKLNKKQKNTLLTNLYFDLAQIKGISQENFSDLFNALVELGGLRTLMPFLPKATKENVKNLQAAVIATGDAKLIAEFAASANGIDMPFMAKTLADTKNGYSIYSLAYFLKYKVFYIDIDEWDSVDIDRRDDFKLSEEEKDTALKILTKGILTSNSPKYIHEFAKEIMDGNITKFEDAVIKIGAAQAIINMATVKGAHVKRLQDAIIQLNDPEAVIQFAKKVKRADIAALSDAIIKFGKAEWIFEFAEKTRKVDVKKLKRAIAQTDDENKDYYLQKLDVLFETEAIADLIDGLEDVDVPTTLKTAQ